MHTLSMPGQALHKERSGRCNGGNGRHTDATSKPGVTAIGLVQVGPAFPNTNFKQQGNPSATVLSKKYWAQSAAI